jgi:host factor-I protein
LGRRDAQQEAKNMSEKAQNVQDVFLNHLRKNKTPVTIFLVNGVKLQGIVTWFDNFSVLLRRDGHSQLVYKHAISTIMPVTPAGLSPAACACACAALRRRCRRSNQPAASALSPSNNWTGVTGMMVEIACL